MKKSCTHILTAAIATIITACGNDGGIQNTLNTAERVMTVNPDSALNLIRKANYNKISTNKELAQYNLIYNSARCELGKRVSMDDINLCVEYYKKHKEYNRLQKSYYCRGCALHMQDKHKEALMDLKRAESLMEETNDTTLLIKIYRKTIDVNNDGCFFNDIPSYCHKELTMATKAKNINAITSALNDMAFAMYLKGDNDSCMFYTEKATMNVAKCSETTKAETYKHIANLYGMYLNKQDSAIAYYKASLRHQNSNSTEILLGYAYINNSELDKALKIVDKLKTSNDKSIKCQTYYLWSKIYFAQKDYKNAYYKIEKANDIDSEWNKNKNEADIKDQQIKFDNENIKAQHSKRIHYIIIWALTILLALTVTIIISLLKIRQKDKYIKGMESKMRGLDHSIEKIKEDSQKTFKEKCRELNNVISQKQRIIKIIEKEKLSLTEENETFRKSTNDISEGLQFMYYIMKDEEGLQMDKNDRTKLIECYRILDKAFVNALEQADTVSLSTQEKLLCIMFRIGKTPQQIKNILCLSDDAYRQTKSRTVRKLKNAPNLKRFCDNIQGTNTQCES